MSLELLISLNPLPVFSDELKPVNCFKYVCETYVFSVILKIDGIQKGRLTIFNFGFLTLIAKPMVIELCNYDVKVCSPVYLYQF